MTVFSFFWQALAKGVFLKWGILVPIPREQEMNDTPGNSPSNSFQIFFRAAAHNHLSSLLQVLSEASSGFWRAGRQHRWKAGGTESECFYQNDQLLMLFLGVPHPPNKKKKRELSNKQELSTPHQTQKFSEIWQASLF